MGSMCQLEDTSLPRGAWDSHVHVVDEENFPLHPDHPYRPKKADLDDLLAFQQKQGISHSSLVAFSVYGNDNRSILDALSRLKGGGRAAACIDPDTVTDEELRTLHDAGTRAIRLNLRTRRQRLASAELRALLHKCAARVRPYGWAIQIYISLDQVPPLVDIIPTLRVPIILDHLGHPDPAKGPVQFQDGYKEFLALLRSGRVWTKLSGTYRFEHLEGLDDYVLEILRTAPNQVVWASDWPHSGGVEANPGGDRNIIQDYRRIDDLAWVVRCKIWCREAGDDTDGQKLMHKIWVENPRRLWQYDMDD